MEKKRKTSPFWMRPVSFEYLRDIILEFASNVDSFTAEEFDREVRRRDLVETAEGYEPSRTLLYHYRNTLTKLGILRREGRKYSVDKGDENVKILLEAKSKEREGLSVAEKTAFAELVIKNEDCKIFFDLFMLGIDGYSLSDFLNKGKPVTWRREGKKPRIEYFNKSRSGRRRPKEKPRKVVFRRQSTEEPILNLTDYDEEKGILFGVRYWAKKELGFIDEFFREDLGIVMYPVSVEYGDNEISQVYREIISLVDKREEWTVFSVRGLLHQILIPLKYPVRVLFDSMRRLKKEHPDLVVYIPTSRSFATFTGGTRDSEELMLRSYYIDPQNRIISHFRVHKSILEA